MKKYLKYMVLIILLIPFQIKADSIHCSAPSSVSQGESFTVEFYGYMDGVGPLWTGKVGFNGNISYNSGDLTIVNQTNNLSHSVTFTAGDLGEATVYTYDVDSASESEEISSGDTCTISIVPPVPKEEEKSSDNFLKSLSIDGVKLNKEFKKDDYEYSAIVSAKTDKININASSEDEDAEISGIGEVALNEGLNRIEITVTAPNGDIKKYILNVTRKEKNPITTKIDGKKYTLLKKDIKLSIPNGFSKTTIVINKMQVEAYSNKYLDGYLVALVDKDGNASWYIYDNKKNTYTKFIYLKDNNNFLVVLKNNKKDIPYKYKKCKIDIDFNMVDGYFLEYNQPFRIIYALNLNNGNKGFYQYDMDEKTFQRFYNSQVEIYRSLLKKIEAVLVSILALLLIFFIIIISLFRKNKKVKKILRKHNIVLKKSRKQKKDDKINKKREKELLKEQRDYFE